MKPLRSRAELNTKLNELMSLRECVLKVRKEFVHCISEQVMIENEYETLKKEYLERMNLLHYQGMLLLRGLAYIKFQVLIGKLKDEVCNGTHN
jgi:hypothetical protein